jgi:hypothetical protein
MDKKIKKILLFDFDGTLCLTPLPDTGKIEYEKKTGNKWSHNGWWSKPDSLDMDIFEMPLLEETIDVYNQHKEDSETLMVMMTGRIRKLSKHVEAILEHHNLIFDRYIYNNGGSTDESKLKSMDELLDEFKDVEAVFQLDDRLLHIPIFEAWGEKQISQGKIKKYDIMVVNPSHH